MGRNPGSQPTMTACIELHAILIENHVPIGAKIPRPLWDRLVGRFAGVSYAQTNNITRTGESQGYWTRSMGRGPIHGSVTLSALPP